MIWRCGAEFSSNVARMMFRCWNRRQGRQGLPGISGAVFITEGGVKRRVAWVSLPEVVGELGRPVRSFPSYRGQRNSPGWCWLPTTGCRVGFESCPVERPYSGAWKPPIFRSSSSASRNGVRSSNMGPMS